MEVVIDLDICSNSVKCVAEISSNDDWLYVSDIMSLCGEINLSDLSKIPEIEDFIIKSYLTQWDTIL